MNEQHTDVRRFIRTYPGALDDALIADLAALEEGRVRFEQKWRRCSQTPVVGDALARLNRVTSECFADYRTLSRTLNWCSQLEIPNVLLYEPSDPDQPEWFHEHADAWDITSASRQVSVIGYLNDVVEGGETEFPAFEFSQRCDKGTILMFPANYMFHHLARPPLSGSKLVVVTWIHFGNGGVPTKPSIPLAAVPKAVPGPPLYSEP